MKKLITLLFSAVLLLSMPVMAAEVDQSRIVNIDASKSIIALGADPVSYTHLTLPTTSRV